MPPHRISWAWLLFYCPKQTIEWHQRIRKVCCIFFSFCRNTSGIGPWSRTTQPCRVTLFKWHHWPFSLCHCTYAISQTLRELFCGFFWYIALAWVYKTHSNGVKRFSWLQNWTVQLATTCKTVTIMTSGSYHPMIEALHWQSKCPLGSTIRGQRKR